MGQLGSTEDAILQKAVFMPMCSHGPQLSSPEHTPELTEPQRARDNTY